MIYNYYKMSNTQRILGPARCYTLWLGGGIAVAVSAVVIGILGNYYLLLDLCMNSDRMFIKLIIIIILNIVVCVLWCLGAIPAYRYFTKYAIDEEKLTLVTPTGKQTAYSWSRIVFADVTFAYVNRQPRRYIRIFFNKHRAKHRNISYSCLEHYLMDQSSVIVIEYSQERLGAIRQIIPIQDSIQK